MHAIANPIICMDNIIIMFEILSMFAYFISMILHDLYMLQLYTHSCELLIDHA